MNRRTCVLALFSTPALIITAACSRGPRSTDASSATKRKPRIHTVNYPLAYVARRLGGDSVDVIFPMRGGGDPADWQPDAATISEFQRSDLILVNSPGYSPWLDKVTLPAAKLFDPSSGFRAELISARETTTHRHGPAGEHTHAVLAATTWLDPRLLRLQAAAVATRLTQLIPTEKVAIAARLEQFTAEWLAWQRTFETRVAARREVPVIASHPVYQYLERAGGLNWRSVHFEPDEMPTPDQWQELATLLKTHPARWMVWEAEPRRDVRERLANEFGLSSVVFDPTGSAPAQGDLLNAMQANLARLEVIYTTKN
jgi:zinc transport system substrate-binding protein